MENEDQLDIMEDGLTERVKLLGTFNHENFANFIKAKGLDKSCEVCDTNDWVTPTGEPDRPSMIKLSLMSPPDQVQIYVPRVCSNCANTKFFNVGWMLALIERDGRKK